MSKGGGGIYVTAGGAVRTKVGTSGIVSVRVFVFVSDLVWGEVQEAELTRQQTEQVHISPCFQ